MNMDKRLILPATLIALFAASELFPPWQYEDEGTSGVRPAGYHHLYSPPKVKSAQEMKAIFSYPNQETPCCVWVRKDQLRLDAQRIALFFLTLGALLIQVRHGSSPLSAIGGVMAFIGLIFLGGRVWLMFQPY